MISMGIMTRFFGSRIKKAAENVVLYRIESQRQFNRKFVAREFTRDETRVLTKEKGFLYMNNANIIPVRAELKVKPGKNSPVGWTI